MIVRKSNYDKFPFVAVPGADDACVAGWAAIGRRLRGAVQAEGRAKTVLVVECYPGVDEAAVREALVRELNPGLTIVASDALKPEAEINRLCEPFLGGGDPVFGYLSNLTLPSFMIPAASPNSPRKLTPSGKVWCSSSASAPV